MDIPQTQRSHDRDARGGDASIPEGLIRRFGVVERLAHWLYAVLFLGALLTGLFMWIPATRVWMADDRADFAQHHGAAGIAMIVVPLLLFVVFNRRALKAGLREVDVWSEHDRRWLGAVLRLRWLTGRELPPQGRLNAGQKLYSVVVAAMSLGFLVTGVFLLEKTHLPAWLVSRSLWLHAFLAVVGAALLVGHMAMALLTRHGRASLLAMIRGTYPEKLARQYHLLWWESSFPGGDDSDR